MLRRAPASLNYAGFCDLCDPRESSLRKLYSTFPGGWTGLGLLLLRVAIGSTLILLGSAYLPQPQDLRLETWAACLLAFAIGTSLLVGFLTPLANSLVVLGGMGIAVSWLPAPNWTLFNCHPLTMDALVVATASALLGPGAFSLDARLFGLRKVIIPRSPGSSRP